MYNGIKEVTLKSDNEIAKFYEGKLDLELNTNQYLILKNKENEVIDKLRWNGSSFSKLISTKIKGFKPKTIKQEFLADMLTNKDVPVKIIAGVWSDVVVPVCPYCGGTNFKDNGHWYTPNGKFNSYRCECQALFRSKENLLSKRKKAVNLIGI
jgi:hypothetical protein